METKKERKIDKKPLYQPPSTKKWEAALEKAKQEKEVKEKLLREKEKEENERLLKKNKVIFLYLYQYNLKNIL